MMCENRGMKNELNHFLSKLSENIFKMQLSVPQAQDVLEKTKR